MNGTAQLRCETRQGIPVVFVTGEVNVLNERQFAAGLESAADPNAPGLVVVLTDAPYLSAGALGALTVTGARLAAAGKRLAVICPERHVGRRMLQMLRFPYRVASSFEEAVSASPTGRFLEAAAKPA